MGGFLGGSNWRHLYWVFAFGIVVFLLVLFCLPKDEVIRESFNGSHEKVEKESTWQIFKGLNPYVYWVYLAVFILGGASIGEAILALFSGGATAVPAVATAIVAAIEGLSSAWGYMMTAVYIIVGLSAALGAATTDVTWVAIPEG